ncbi:hypothetical protein KP509_11G082600 [Ceratopteris richardii]|uniref:GTD-binding domain-containing protein n=1 Tax=Ceratopteris richardii TaxID=49495 RepID=A0A8T2TRN5_CERRI|nr:hypothetical protein KP509_11G082600 [Ceratopteris richardii]KAH7426046.1 hypothetical protein KP509_11G082600 [Ceratopteris richardii]KAH7426047.1 hypothetical protein KP509_11G082600 [Ceratopteris richardii]
MRRASDLRSYPAKRTDERSCSLIHVNGDFECYPRQRSVKRKLPSSACVADAQNRKQENAFYNVNAPRPPKHLASFRKSISDPLRVFDDSDESSNQQGAFSMNSTSDFKQTISRGQRTQHRIADTENVPREKRGGPKPGLKDRTNLEPKISVKQINDNTRNEILALKEALHSEREAHRALQAELEQERNASSSAANEAMSMIARIQEEKAAVLMEARQFKRIAEERELHNQEAITLLKEMLLNKEEEALALEHELTMCRNMLLAIEAGEPVQNLMVRYLDAGEHEENSGVMEIFHGLNKGSSAGWTGFERHSKGLRIFGTGLQQGSNKEESMTSEFTRETFNRTFNALETGNIRGNLEAYFDKAGQVTEEMALWKDKQLDKGAYENLSEKGRSVGVSNTVQESPSIWSQHAVHDYRDVDSLQWSVAFSGGKGISECESEPPGCVIDEQNRSIWDRIKKLEHRLETFGVDSEQGFEFGGLHGNIEETPETPGFKFPNKKAVTHCRDRATHSKTHLEEIGLARRDFATNSMNLQMKGGLQDHEAGAAELISSEESICQSLPESPLKIPGRESSHVSEQSHSVVALDVVENLHDIYVVDIKSTQFPQSSSKSSEVDGSSDPVVFMEKPCSPTELMKPVMETMAVTPPDSADVRNLSSSLSGTEIQQLHMRLQTLENEKRSMQQAVMALQAENRELKSVQTVALQLGDTRHLQNLKRSVQTSEQPCKRAKSEQTSFSSLFRGFLSYLPSCSMQENHR